VDIERLELLLPDGAALRASGQLSRIVPHLQGTVEATRLDIPDDLLFLPRNPTTLRGLMDAQARLGGTWNEPVLKGSVQCGDLK